MFIYVGFFFYASTEEATRFDEFPAKAGDEIREGHFGLQGHIEIVAEDESKDGADCIQLSPSAKKRGGILCHVG